jgi:hypothetical protein
MQIGATQASAANAYNDIKWAGHLWLWHLLDGGLFLVVV